jgi:hypothetical protein
MRYGHGVRIWNESAKLYVFKTWYEFLCEVKVGNEITLPSLGLFIVVAFDEDSGTIDVRKL